MTQIKITKFEEVYMITNKSYHICKRKEFYNILYTLHNNTCL